MFDVIFNKKFGVRVKRRYTGRILRRKKGKLGYIPLPRPFRLPKRLTRERAAFIECIKSSSDCADDRYAQRVEVKYISRQVGYGVFAREEIDRGVIGIYTGVLKRESNSGLSRYLFSFTTKLLDDIVIDGEKWGNWTAFMNHSPANGRATNIEVFEFFYKGIPYIIFHAFKKIKKGRQLLYDYGSNYWDALEAQPKKL